MSEWRDAWKKPVKIRFREVTEFEKIKTREGELFAYPSQDYIIEGVDGEQYPIKKDVFDETYSLVDEKEKKWAYLNVEGRLKWGGVFTDGYVPISGLVPVEANLDEMNEVVAVYRVDLLEIDASTLEELYSKLAYNFASNPNEVRKTLDREGLAIRASLVDFTIKAVGKVGAIL
jgi:hypothetical protein